MDKRKSVENLYINSKIQKLNEKRKYFNLFTVLSFILSVVFAYKLYRLNLAGDLINNSIICNMIEGVCSEYYSLLTGVLISIISTAFVLIGVFLSVNSFAIYAVMCTIKEKDEEFIIYRKSLSEDTVKLDILLTMCITLIVVTLIYSLL